MTTYFIAPFYPCETCEDWKLIVNDDQLFIDPNWYREELLKRWPNTTFFQISPDVMLLEWHSEILQGHELLPLCIAALHHDGQVVSCDTPVEAFFLWHRRVIPSQYRLFLWTESDHKNVFELKPNTTWEELAHFFGR